MQWFLAHRDEDHSHLFLGYRDEDRYSFPSYDPTEYTFFQSDDEVGLLIPSSPIIIETDGAVPGFGAFPSFPLASSPASSFSSSASSLRASNHSSEAIEEGTSSSFGFSRKIAEAYDQVPADPADLNVFPSLSKRERKKQERWERKQLRQEARAGQPSLIHSRRRERNYRKSFAHCPPIVGYPKE